MYQPERLSEPHDGELPEPRPISAAEGLELVQDEPDQTGPSPLDLDDPELLGAEDEEIENPDSYSPNPLALQGESQSLDPLQQFLTEAGKHELLNTQQEITLSRKIEKIKPASWIIDGEDPSQLDKKQKLAKRIEDRDLIVYADLKSQNLTLDQLNQTIVEGRRAKDLMIESNLRLVVSIAKKYRKQGLPFLDLIQEGSIGLNRAAEKFDWRKGFKFSTYATWWIRQGVARALADKARTIRMPVHVVERLNKILRAERELRGSLGYQPTNQEIAAELDMTPEQVEEIRRVAQATVSLDKPVGEDEDATFGDLQTDFTQPGVDEQVIESDYKQQLGNQLERLSERERTVLELRYGLNGRPHTLDEIANQLGVTRERIRQIEKQGLAKLRELNGVKDA